LRREIVPVDRGKSGGDLPRSAALRELLARRFSIAHRAEHNALYPKDCLLALGTLIAHIHQQIGAWLTGRSRWAWNARGWIYSMAYRSKRSELLNVIPTIATIALSAPLNFA
jgi:hypothetical protein